MSSTREQSNNRNHKPRSLYSLRIRTLEHLGLMLGCSVRELRKWEKTPSNFYRTGTFITKNGRERPKAVPFGRLRVVVENLNALLQRLDLPDAIHGGRRGRSHLTNARRHFGRPMLLKLDIRDCFPSIKRDQVRQAFQHRCKCSPSVARTLAAITTPFGDLPQGSPASPMIAVIVLTPLVERLQGLATQHGARNGQFFDDTTLSGPNHLASLRDLCIKIIRSEGYDVSLEKVVAVPGNCEQVVTGVRVDCGRDAPQEQQKEIRHAVAAIERGDIDAPPFPSVRGKIVALSKLNRGAAKPLQRRLMKVEMGTVQG